MALFHCRLLLKADGTSRTKTAAIAETGSSSSAKTFTGWRRSGSLALTIALAATLAACARSGEPPQVTTAPRTRLVAASYPAYWVANEISGGRVSIEMLPMQGPDPHHAELGPAGMEALKGADIVVAASRDFEWYLSEALRAAGNPEQRSFWLEDGVKETGEATPAALSDDPHFWLDPLKLAAGASYLAGQLSRLEPDIADAVDAARRGLTDRLNALHSAYEMGFRECRSRTFVVYHAAFGHLAARYGLVQVSVVGTDPEAEPRRSAIDAAVETARRESLPMVFSDPESGREVMEEVARSSGATVELLDPLEVDQEGENYEQRMYANLSKLMAALRCSP